MIKKYISSSLISIFKKGERNLLIRIEIPNETFVYNAIKKYPEYVQDVVLFTIL